MHSTIGRTRTHTCRGRRHTVRLGVVQTQAGVVTVGRSTWFWTAEHEDRKTGRGCWQHGTHHGHGTASTNSFGFWEDSGFKQIQSPLFLDTLLVWSLSNFSGHHACLHMTCEDTVVGERRWLAFKKGSISHYRNSRVDFTQKGCQTCSIWLNTGRKNRSIDFSFHIPSSVRLIYTYALFSCQCWDIGSHSLMS